MRTLFLLAALWLIFAAANVASARPTAFYNPANGDITLSNDTGLVLPVIYMSSQSGTPFVADPGAFLAVPGSQLDAGDLPLGFTYIDFPMGAFNIGNVVVPGTKASSLSGGYNIACLGCQLAIIQVPETATLALLLLGVLPLLRSFVR